MRLARAATAIFVTMLCATTASPASNVTAAGDDPAGDCMGRLLEAASVSSDSFPRLTLYPDPEVAREHGAAWGVDADVGCSADAGPAGVVYLVVAGDVEIAADVEADFALGDEIVIVEPGGRPEARLDDPGMTWSEVDRISDLIDRLVADDPHRIDLGLPDPDQSPVRLLAVSNVVAVDEPDTDRHVRVVWQFSEVGDDHAGEIESSLAAAISDEMTVEVTGDEVATVIDRSGDRTRPLPPMTELALLAGIETGEQQFPDVIDVGVTCSGDAYDFAVTISSLYDTPERYADGWQVYSPGPGAVYGEHQLAHDHAAEQPFTRTQRGVEIPGDVGGVVVEARDRVNGYGGQAFFVPLPDCPP